MTVIELLTMALVKINVIDETESPSAEQGARALTGLNMMLAQWRQDGIDIGFYNQTDMNAVVPLDFATLRGVIFNAAVEFSTDYGVTTSEEVRAIASDTYAALAKAFRKTFEADMTQLPMADSDYWYGTWPFSSS